MERLKSLRIKNTKNINKNTHKNASIRLKSSRHTIWNPLSKAQQNNISNTSQLSANNIENISTKLKKLFYNSESLTGYIPSITLHNEILKFYLAIIFEIKKEKYQREIENINKNNGNDNYFLITEEDNYWNSAETDKVWYETLNTPQVINTYKLIQTEYHKDFPTNNKLAPINKTEILKNKNFNVLFNTQTLKDNLISKGLKQTFQRDTPNIKVLFYNSNYRTSFYNETQALIKNRLESQSLTCIKYKDFLYENLVLVNELNHNFLPYSVIIKKPDTVTIEDLNLKFKTFYTSYETKYKGIAILPSQDNLDENIYIVRAVEFVDYYKYTASCGFGITIIKNDDDIEKKLKPLFTKFKTLIISKFLKTKLTPLEAYNPLSKTIITGNINYNIRITFLYLLTKNPLSNNYELWCYIIKKGKILTASKFLDKHSTTNKSTNNSTNNSTNKSTMHNQVDKNNITEDVAAFDTHEGIYSLSFEDNTENDINRNYKLYFKQIEHIIKSIGDVLKYRVKIYPECTHGFDEFTIDLILASNDILYLAEVNNNSNVNMYEQISYKIAKKQQKYKFNNDVKKQLEQSKDNSFYNYTTSLFSIINNGIIDPILENTPIDDNDTEYYKSFKIHDNIATVPRLKNGIIIPIQ